VRAWWRRVAVAAAGGVIGGIAGAAAAALVTELIKRILAVVSGGVGVGRGLWVLVIVPLVGLTVAVLV
jgi:hypothetical protein